MKLAQIVFQFHWCPTFEQVEYYNRGHKCSTTTDTEVRGTRGFGGDEFENVMHNCGVLEGFYADNVPEGSFFTKINLCMKSLCCNPIRPTAFLREDGITTKRWNGEKCNSVCLEDEGVVRETRDGKTLHPPLIPHFGKINLQEISLHHLIRSSFFCPAKELLACRFIVPIPRKDWSSGIGLLLVGAGGIIAWTRYKMNVKACFYSHGVVWVKEKDIDKDKEFDAFISFSHIDQDFAILELIKRIEEEDPDIRLCLHYKHFLPGEFIQENIVRAVECFQRTVLALSRNILESEWCLLEFKLAHVQALKDHVPRIIIIKLADLPKDEELPKEIQLYLKSTTFLIWGEKRFWNKLLYTLPRSQSVSKLKSRDDARLQIPMANF
ncbi:protein toll [Caerostris darwini]|uniref:Protein toll n=1 Tax=Caerostris darwini TaxID=1538125 RepID=A0AAV4MUB3_9ARAC|nr:protein toll [Caerostris darwini]